MVVIAWRFEFDSPVSHSVAVCCYLDRRAPTYYAPCGET